MFSFLKKLFLKPGNIPPTKEPVTDKPETLETNTCIETKVIYDAKSNLITSKANPFEYLKFSDPLTNLPDFCFKVFAEIWLNCGGTNTEIIAISENCAVCKFATEQGNTNALEWQISRAKYDYPGLFIAINHGVLTPDYLKVAFLFFSAIKELRWTSLQSGATYSRIYPLDQLCELTRESIGHVEVLARSYTAGAVGLDSFKVSSKHLVPFREKKKECELVEAYFQQNENKDVESSYIFKVISLGDKIELCIQATDAYCFITEKIGALEYSKMHIKRKYSISRTIKEDSSTVLGELSLTHPSSIAALTGSNLFIQCMLNDHLMP